MTGPVQESLLLSGPLLRSVVRVAAPAMAFQLLVFLNNFVDYQWVQRLGPEAAAGQTAAWTIFWMLLNMGQVFSIGATAVIARRIGEGKQAAALHAATHGMRGALIASVLVGVVGWLAAPWLVGLLALSEKATGYATDYLLVAAAGAPLYFCFYSVEGAFKGRGDMRRPLRAVATALGLNMVLDPLLIHVLGLEVAGAALATVLSFGITAALLVRVGVRRGWVGLSGRGLDLGVIRRVVSIGAPLSVHGILFSLVYLAINREVNLAGGDAAGAALGLGLRIEGFAYMTGVGLAAGAAALVGQNLGAGRLRRAHDAAWTSVRLGVWITGCYGLAMLIAPFGLVAWLSPDALTASHAQDYLRIVSFAVAFTAVEIILQGAFSGAGNTLPPMLLAIPLTVVRVPLAIFAGPRWGVAGIFWVLAVTAVIRGLLFAFWFARGRWIHAKA